MRPQGLSQHSAHYATPCKRGDDYLDFDNKAITEISRDEFLFQQAYNLLYESILNKGRYTSKGELKDFDSGIELVNVELVNYCSQKDSTLEKSFQEDLSENPKYDSTFMELSNKEL